MSNERQSYGRRQFLAGGVTAAAVGTAAMVAVPAEAAGGDGVRAGRYVVARVSSAAAGDAESLTVSVSDGTERTVRPRGFPPGWTLAEGDLVTVDTDIDEAQPYVRVENERGRDQWVAVNDVPARERVIATADR